MVADLPSRVVALFVGPVVQLRRGGIPGSFGRSVGHPVGPFSFFLLSYDDPGHTPCVISVKKKNIKQRGYEVTVTVTPSPRHTPPLAARLAPFNSYAAHDLKQKLFDPLLSLLNRIQPSCPF